MTLPKFQSIRRQPPPPHKNESFLVKDPLVASCKDVDTLHEIPLAGNDLALFHRHEVRVGNLVGAGSFSEVYEITGFDDSISSISSKKKTVGRSSSSSSKRPKTSDKSDLDPARRHRRHVLMMEQEQNTRDRCSGACLQSLYVIKQLHSKLARGDPKTFRRAVKDMVTEVSIMSLLTHHPHMVHLQAISIGGTAALANGKHDSFFLVMDRLVETLDDRIHHWNVDKTVAGPSYFLDSATNDARIGLKANYAWQIASALNYLHQHNIIFRDLKPQNIGFRQPIHPDHPERDVVALFDFGLSRIMPPAHQADAQGLFHMSLVGTRRYMASEVVLNRTYNTKADVYSWALCFYEMVSQQRPYDNMQRGEHKELVCVAGKRPKLYPYYGLPPVLEQLIWLGWAQNVAQRMTMHQVCQVLQNYLAGSIHENAVRTMDSTNTDSNYNNNNNDNDMVPSHHGTSESSIGTDQTVSTSDSLFFEDDEKEEVSTSSNKNTTSVMEVPALNVVTTNGALSLSEHVVSEATAQDAELVIVVSSRSHDLPITSHPRRMSFCERCTKAFHSHVSSAFQLLQGTKK